MSPPMEKVLGFVIFWMVLQLNFIQDKYKFPKDVKQTLILVNSSCPYQYNRRSRTESQIGQNTMSHMIRANY